MADSQLDSQAARIDAQAPPGVPPFTCKVAGNVHAILEQFGVSLVVSTYQAGRLIIVRARPDGGINTHFVVTDKAMGVATSPGRFAVGSRRQIVEFRNVSSAAKKVEPVNTHDACYVPWASHTTGDIDVHEMARAGDGQLWFVNTRFSCLCTLHPDYSFQPQWRPWFVTGYAPHDRCHLNGLAMASGRPKYVTSLGVGDTRSAWRENKAHGGTIMDVQKNEFICQGLSMPHSPRVHRDKLWVLESGEGSLAYVDQKTGKLETVCQLPGFTRGLDFVNNVAFIGLSEIRESQSFGGLPITQRLTERVCGVWMVDIDTGKVLGILRFEGAVHEIFAVQVLHKATYPAVIEPTNPVLDTSYTLADEVLKQIDYDAIERESALQAKAAQDGSAPPTG